MENLREYDETVDKLRSFFRGRGYKEVPAQSRLSILAACEDPSTIARFSFSGVEWPLPQTGQMWLEHDLLRNPDLPGVYCVTTSYRDEPNPVPGRHDRIFPMFEFEGRGGIDELKLIERRVLRHLGFGDPISVNYEEACFRYGVDVLDAEHEGMLQRDFGDAVSLESFPLRTHPFWNMKHVGRGVFNKVDVLLHGMETIGSAERSTDADEMRHFFGTISGGEYSGLLYEQFGKDRVDAELDRYLGLRMFPRFGGGIGVTRLVRAMKLEGVLESAKV